MSAKRRLIVAEDLARGNGTTTIPTDSGGTRAATKISLRTFTDIRNVKDFGAVGDGVTDDTAAIQAAIDSLTAGSVLFPEGNFKAHGIVGKSYVSFKGLGPYNSSIITGASGQPTISFVTGSASIEFVEIEGLTFKGSGAKAIYASSLTNYLSTFLIHNNHFSAELTEGIYGNLILCDISNNDFGLFGTAGAASRHIYSKGNLAGNASNINRVTNNRMYHAAGDQSCYFDSGYMLYFIGNNVERNDATISLTVKGMYGVIIENNWFEQNAGTYQISLENDAGAVNGNYIVPVENNWFDLSHAGNTTVLYLDGATIALDIINNAGVMSNAQFLTHYNGFDDDNIGVRTFSGNRMVGTYTAPVRHFLEGVVTAVSVATSGKMRVGSTTLGTLIFELIHARSDGIRGKNSSNSDRIAYQLIADSTDLGVLELENASEAVKVRIKGNGSIFCSGLAAYANNAAAIGGGLVAGDFYRTNADPDTVCVVH